MVYAANEDLKHEVSGFVLVSKALIVSLFLSLLLTNTSVANTLPLNVEFGQKLFFDTNLSSPAGQACASCHNPKTGFADSNEIVSDSASGVLYGKRNAPSIAYSNFTPRFHFDTETNYWLGGLAHDGRAQSLEDQVKGPLLQPLEMGNSDISEVVDKVRESDYAPLLTELKGETIWQSDEKVFAAMSSAIAAFERHESFANRFSSKFDAYLQGTTTLSEQEMRGLKLFEDKQSGNCAACHTSQITQNGSPPLFTNFSYHNIGIPKQPKNLYYYLPKQYNPDGRKFIDSGLANNPYVEDKDKAKALGQFKVPTLRNVAITSPYMHNGAFFSLRDAIAVHQRHIEPDRWNAPEVIDNFDTKTLATITLKENEIEDIVVFLHTLTDGWSRVSQ